MRRADCAGAAQITGQETSMDRSFQDMSTKKDCRSGLGVLVSTPSKEYLRRPTRKIECNHYRAVRAVDDRARSDAIACSMRR